MRIIIQWLHLWYFRLNANHYFLMMLHLWRILQSYQSIVTVIKQWVLGIIKLILVLAMQNTTHVHRLADHNFFHSIQNFLFFISLVRWWNQRLLWDPKSQRCSNWTNTQRTTYQKYKIFNKPKAVEALVKETQKVWS